MYIDKCNSTVTFLVFEENLSVFVSHTKSFVDIGGEISQFLKFSFFYENTFSAKISWVAKSGLNLKFL